MSAEFVEWVQKLSGGWPPLIGAMVGSLLGIISLLIGALFNAHLNRKAERKRELRLRFGIVEALIAEITTVSESLERAIASFDDELPEHGWFFVPDMCPENEIFRKFIDSIYLFDKDIIKEINDTYTILNEYTFNALMAGAELNNKDYKRPILIVRPKSLSKVKQVNESILKACRELGISLRTHQIFNRHNID